MRKFLGDKKFYMMVLSIAVPIMIQNGITNFVSLLDNVMIGVIGTEQMSGVAIANQIVFVFNLCVFGGVSGAGIFTAQFFGKGDQNGVRYTFRFKLMTCAALSLIMIILILTVGDRLVRLYLTGTADAGDSEITFEYGLRYLRIMAVQLIPFALAQTYASTLRECGNAKLPMLASMVAVVVNLCLNWILIYGKFGMPALGVTGAAIATVISRFAELFVIVFAAHRNREKFPFLTGAYRSMRIPISLVKSISLKGMPLLVNEFLWASGMATLAQYYSVRGLSVVAAYNISSTVSNLFNVVYIALGNAVAIIVGQLLGAGEMEKAREEDRKLIFFSVASCLLVGTLLAISSPFIPMLYNTTDEVRHLATVFLLIVSGTMPIHAFNNSSYFTLRSGGRAFVTFIFDSIFLWTIPVPVIFCITRFTSLSIGWIYLIAQSLELIKCVTGGIMIKKGVWIRNIVADENLT